MAEFVERRPFSRIHFNAPAQLRQQALSQPAEVLDISLKGALLAVGDESSLDPSEPLSLDIAVSDGIHIVMDGRVAHRETGRVGVACESIDLDSIQHLRRLIELNLGDADAMERELSELVRPRPR